MREFNYIRAWKEYARPAFEALPADILELVNVVICLAPILSKQRGDSGDYLSFARISEVLASSSAEARQLWAAKKLNFANLEERFKSQDKTLLAKASSIVFHYGHWFPAKENNDGADRTITNTGAYWMFQKLCDHVEAYYKAYEQQNPIADAFMDHKPETEMDADEIVAFAKEPASDLWDIHSYCGVNWRVKGEITGGHPPVIGGPDTWNDTIPWAEKRCDKCKNPMKAHTCDRVLVLQLKRNVDEHEARAALVALTDRVSQHNMAHPKDAINLAGFCFTSDTFTINTQPPVAPLPAASNPPADLASDSPASPNAPD